MKTSWKDILIGALVAYVVIDLMMAYTMKKTMPSLVEKMVSSLDDQSAMVAIVVGLLVGGIAWYFAKQSKECFIPSKLMADERIQDE